MKKHRQRMKPEEVPFPVYSIPIIAKPHTMSSTKMWKTKFSKILKFLLN